MTSKTPKEGGNWRVGGKNQMKTTRSDPTTHLNLPKFNGESKKKKKKIKPSMGME